MERSLRLSSTLYKSQQSSLIFRKDHVFIRSFPFWVASLRDCRILRFACMPTKQTWRSMPRSERYSSDMGLWDTLHVWLAPSIAMWYSNSFTCYICLFSFFLSGSCDVACSHTWKWKMCELTTRAVQLKSMKEIWRKPTQVINPNTKSTMLGSLKKKTLVTVGCMNYVPLFWSIISKSSDRLHFFMFIHIGATPKWSNHLIKGYVGWF